LAGAQHAAQKGQQLRAVRAESRGAAAAVAALRLEVRRRGGVGTPRRSFR
jgi:hypothetical protein